MTVHDALGENIREIRVKIEQHEQLLQRLKEGGDIDIVVLKHGYEDCPHSRVLRETLLEAVEVLESSRKAFKSRELEMLRKKMIRVLADNTGL